jgi:aryl-alcohol dehydrogenase-like predicted oxidoreductase
MRSRWERGEVASSLGAIQSSTGTTAADGRPAAERTEAHREDMRMDNESLLPRKTVNSVTRRRLLKQVGQGAIVGAVASTMLQAAGCGRSPEPPPSASSRPAGTPGVVRHRTLGRTGLSVSEVGFGGHSWSYTRVPEGEGFRKVSVEEATRMISIATDMGVNFLDCCSPAEEHTTPAEAVARLKKRAELVVCVRCLFKSEDAGTMGTKADKSRLIAFVDEHLKTWRSDHFDILVASTTLSGFWDLSYCIEAVETLKKQGKIRFSGFGTHFTPAVFQKMIDRFGRDFDICSMPYSVRERAAERLFPLARQAGLGIVTIKPFARGSLLKGLDLTGQYAGVARDMIAAVLENEAIGVCICGVHTEAQLRENFSASWATLTPSARQRLERFRGAVAWAPGDEHSWLEHWHHA